MVWGPSYEGFCALLSPCLVFLEKPIFTGFFMLFEAYHENLHKISNRLVHLTPVGMVGRPSYEGFCVFVVPVFCFSLKTHTSWLSHAF